MYEGEYIDYYDSGINYDDEEKIQPIVKDSLKLNSFDRIKFMHNVPYIILECEYKDLEQLKKDDLIKADDKGKYLIGCIGLTQEQRDLFLKHREFFENVMGTFTNQIVEKEKANLFMDALRFDEIKFVLDFDQNHSYNQSNGTQLDKKLCIDTIDKGIFALSRLQTLEKMLLKINKEINEYKVLKDVFYPESKERVIKDLMKKITEFGACMHIDTQLTSLIQKEAKNTKAIENIAQFYHAHTKPSQTHTNTR